MKRARWLLVAAMLLPAPAALPAVAKAAGVPERVNQQTSERLRVLFPRAELMLRTGDVDGALAVLDRLIALAEQEGGPRSAADRLLLRRAYELRASLRWEQGTRQSVDEDLDRIIELDPTYEPAEGTVASALRQRFRARRERKVGYLRIGRFPANANIVLDGRALEDVPDLLPVLAGDHVVRGELRGYAAAVEQVRVRANRTEGVGITLERSSATLKLMTRPSGATLSLDGELVGQTRGPQAQEFGASPETEEATSLPLVVDGLLPGWHEIEVSLPGYRPFRQRVEVPDLADYDLGTLDLQRSLGILLLRGLPSGALIWVDGALAGPQDGGPMDAARLNLTIGSHFLLVDAGRAGVFESSVSIGDGETTALDVRVRPAIAWLGTVGGDALDRDAVTSGLLPDLARADGWALLDRSADTDALRERVGLADGELANGAAPEWQEFRGEAREAIGAGVFLLAVLPPERPAAWADLHLWSADEALPTAVLRYELGAGAGAQTLLDAMMQPLPAPRAWIGVQLIDDPEGGAVVVDVAPSSPGAQAGLVFGDRVVSVDGSDLITAAQLSRVIEAAEPFASLALEVMGASGRRSVLVSLGSSPAVPPHGAGVELAPIAWAAAAAEIARADSVYPAWSMQLLQAGLALQAGSAERAAELLGGVTPTAASPFGSAAIDYWHAVALLSLPQPDDETAAMLLRRAAESENARMFHNDGPRVAPAARARLRALQPR